MYKIIEQNGVKHRPLTVKAAQDLFAKNRELVYELIPGNMNILAHLNLARDHMAPHEGGRYYTPINEDVYGDYSENPIICPNCGHTEFYAHQVVRMDVIVGSDNEWLGNAKEDTDSSIYDSETPYGPYTCTKCKYEFDTD